MTQTAQRKAGGYQNEGHKGILFIHSLVNLFIY
jgi:hypothetical protein